MKNLAVRRVLGAGFVGLATFSLAACGGKPSEGEIKDKLMEMYASVGLPEEQAEQVADCAAPKMEDQLSGDTLDELMELDAKDIASNDDPKISEEDDEKLDAIFDECGEAVMEDTGSAPAS